jgi:hypothetical protein
MCDITCPFRPGPRRDLGIPQLELGPKEFGGGEIRESPTNSNYIPVGPNSVSRDGGFQLLL